MAESSFSQKISSFSYRFRLATHPAFSGFPSPAAVAGTAVQQIGRFVDQHPVLRFEAIGNRLGEKVEL